MRNKYLRPFCKNCKLIFGKQSIGIVLKCPECGRHLILKSFNPYLNIGKGVGVISLGTVTIFIGLPVIWIGGFIYGFKLIKHAFKQQSDIKELDTKRYY